jgi:Arc/MetJ family transcription regulator
MAVRKTTLTIDDEVVDRAREILGTDGIKDTIDAALERVILAHAHRDYFDRLRTMRGLDLEDPATVERAWHESG